MLKKLTNSISFLLLALSLGIANKTLAAGAPTINSLGGNATSSTTATVEVNVWANDLTTTVTLQYTLQSGFTSGLQSVNLGTITGSEGSATKSTLLTGLLPDRVYYFRFMVSNSAGTVYSSNNNVFITPPSVVYSLPQLSNVSSMVISATTANVQYSVIPSASTNLWVQYGTNPNFVTGLITSPQVTVPAGNVAVPQSVTLNNLTAGATYYFRIRASNLKGDIYSDPQSFVATPPVANLLTEYTFNNTYNNTNGTAPFSTNAGVSFVNDRSGNANSAINIVNTGTSAIITNLPYGAAARTVSLWVKLNNFSTTPYNMLYSYGVAGTGQVNGASFSAGDVWQFGYNNNHQATLVNSQNTWYNFVFTYDGTNSKIYRDGVLISTMAKTWNTINNSNTFKLGVGVGGELSFDGAIDDLKIYNYALSLNEVSALYQSSLVTSIDESATSSFKIYPNPAKDILHVSGNAEIFDLVGNKVASGTNEINIEHLLSGIYVVKANGKSQKIVKE